MCYDLKHWVPWLRPAKKIRVAVSGYFNPLHIGHLAYLKEAKKLGDELIVIVNNSIQTKLKGSFEFHNEYTRCLIIQELKDVDWVVCSIDETRSVARTLRHLHPDIFANGGDVGTLHPEEAVVCKELGIEVVFGVGGSDKKDSSSWILNKYYNQVWKDING